MMLRKSLMRFVGKKIIEKMIKKLIKKLILVNKGKSKKTFESDFD